MIEMTDYSRHDIARILLLCADQNETTTVPSDIFHLDFKEAETRKAVHYLSHFLDDEDIRANDKIYDTFMRETLRAHASALLKG